MSTPTTVFDLLVQRLTCGSRKDYITLEALRKHAEKLGGADAMRHLEQADADKDGRLTLAECTKGFNATIADFRLGTCRSPLRSSRRTAPVSCGAAKWAR